jgi:hemoglobin
MNHLTRTPARQAPSADLASRADVEALLRRFYGQALHDDILAEPFDEIRTRGLEAHLPVMCDFWETVLFRAGLYRGSALQAHKRVHHRIALSANHFLRWLTLWTSTVDHMYHGPIAEHAKIQAARIAASMHRHLTDNSVPELDGRAGQPCERTSADRRQRPAPKRTE